MALVDGEIQSGPRLKGDILGANGILSTDAWVLFDKHSNAFHEQRNLRTKTMSALKNMDENRTTLIPNYANLRHGRAEQLANASRLLGTSWGSLFEMSVEESFAVDPSILVAFDVGEHDDVLRRNFIAPMEQIIRKWASYTKFRPKASTPISFVQSGIKLLFDSFGLTHTNVPGSLTVSLIISASPILHAARCLRCQNELKAACEPQARPTQAEP